YNTYTYPSVPVGVSVYYFRLLFVFGCLGVNCPEIPVPWPHRLVVARGEGIPNKKSAERGTKVTSGVPKWEYEVAAEIKFLLDIGVRSTSDCQSNSPRDEEESSSGNPNIP